MPFEIVRNDIVNMQVDAIVNPANPKAAAGAGTDAGIHKKAGRKLLWARKKIGVIKTGDAAITPGFRLDAKFVIHTAGPVWQGGVCDEENLLASCYRASLRLAAKHHCESIAFPLLSAGTYGFPKSLALQIAIREFSSFLMENEMRIYLVVFDRDSFVLSEKLFASVSSYIDENYVRVKIADEYGGSESYRQNRNSIRVQQVLDLQETCTESKSFSAAKESAFLPPSKPECESLLSGKPECVSFPSGDQECESLLSGDQACASFPPPAGATASLTFDRQETAPRFALSASALLPPDGSIPAPFHADLSDTLSCKAQDLESALGKLDAGFSETLLHLIDQTGKKDSEIYKKANIDRKLFSKIRNNRDYKPSKPTSLAFAIALELNLAETKDFIARAGYALSHSSKFDIIVEYFIQNSNYNIFELNEVLFAFDQPLIGS